MFTLRPYQQAATDAAISFLRQSVEPILIDAAPAAGKSFMVADLAHRLHQMSGGKRVLCLQPNKELVEQNHEKFLLTGERASIFSASAGSKSTRNYIVFGTPKTVANSISRFTRTGKDGYCAVIVDEAHGLTPTIKDIIAEMQEANPNLRVIGLTGTPYRLNSGYIFRMWPDGTANGDDVTRDPYFLQCVYRVSAREMLDQGFITPMEIGAINEAYDVSGIELLPNGTFNHSTVERAFEGHGRKTAAIVADVIAKANQRAGNRGVMYFAATVQHAQEIMASLPPENSALVTGDECVMFGKPAPRKVVIESYRAKKFRHLVSVGTLTTGFDVPHTEIIALLRHTESAALLQQILGRAWRLDEGKSRSLLLDYAGNVEKHFPDGNIYEPAIKVRGKGGDSIKIEAVCPDCSFVNEFSLNGEYAEYPRDEAGYCLDAWGERIETDYGPLPSHYGRRCMNELAARTSDGKYLRCNYRWTSKECENCGEPNDIAARYCCACKAEIVNPNDKLIAEFKAMKRDPTVPQTDRVISVETREGMSRAGNETLRVDFVTEYRQFSVWLMPEPTNARAKAQWEKWQETGGSPRTVSYVKEPDSAFYRVLAYNQPADDDGLTGVVAEEAEKLKRRKAA